MFLNHNDRLNRTFSKVLKVHLCKVLKVHCILSCFSFRHRVDVTRRHEKSLRMCNIYISVWIVGNSTRKNYTAHAQTIMMTSRDVDKSA